MNKAIRNSIVFGTFFLLTACIGSDEKTTQTMQRPVTRVSTVNINPVAVVLYSEMPGRTLAFEKAEVRPEVTGIIQERVFKEGSSVKKGDTLYLIDSELYEASYANAKANQARAEAALNVAKLKDQRIAILRKQNSVSQQDYDETRAIYLQAKAEVEAARATAKTAKINLDRTQIQAPLSGLIGKSTVSVGTLLSTSQANPLATIYQINPMNVDLIQSAQELVSMRQKVETQGDDKVSLKKTDNLDLPVILILNDGSQYEHKGRLSFMDVGVDESTATMTLRAEFPNPEYLLMPGLFIRAKVQVGIEEEALLIPQKSVLRNAKGQPYVFVASEITPSDAAPSDAQVDPKNDVKAEKMLKAKAQRRNITLGDVYGENWLVLDGLEAGDNIIVEGLHNVAADAEIVIVSTTPVEIPPNADYLLKNTDINMKQEAKLDKIVEEELRENN